MEFEWHEVADFHRVDKPPSTVDVKRQLFVSCSWEVPNVFQFRTRIQTICRDFGGINIAPRTIL